MTQAKHRAISPKLRILNHAIDSGNVSQACRYFGVSRETFHQWKKAYERDGERALITTFSHIAIRDRKLKGGRVCHHTGRLIRP